MTLPPGRAKLVNEPARHRIANTIEDNGDGSRCLLCGQGGERACSGHNNIDPERNQFGRENWQPLGFRFGRSEFDL